MDKNSVSIEDVKHIAELSRLEFSENEIENFRKDLEGIVEYCSILSEINTDEVCEEDNNIGKVRADEVEESISKQDVVKNAPCHTESAFIVPRVVE